MNVPNQANEEYAAHELATTKNARTKRGCADARAPCLIRDNELLHQYIDVRANIPADAPLQLNADVRALHVERSLLISKIP